MGNTNNNLVPFVKTWKQNDGSYAEKQYWFNPSVQFAGMEGCRIKKNGVEVECTKIFYPDRYITLIGSVDYFVQTCRDANIIVCIFNELDRGGYTIKQFMEQTGHLNDVNLM